LQNILEKAEALYKSGDISAAEKEYLRIIEQDGNFYSAQFNLGILYFNSGKPEKALECFDKCIKGGFANASVYNYIGIILQNSGEVALSVSYFNAALNIEPENILILNNISLSYFLIGRENDALECLQKALKIAPDDYETYYNLGFIYFKINQLEKAEEQYLKVLKINPAHKAAKWNLGEIYLSREIHEKAEIIFNEIYNDDKNNYEAKYNLAVSLQKQKKYIEALIIYDELNNDKKLAGKAFFNSGNIFKEKKENGKAEECYTKALKYDSGNCELWNNLGLVQIETFEYGKAEASFRNALNLKPFYTDAISNLAALFYEMEKPDEAIKFYNSAIEISSENDLHFNKALALLAKGNFEEGFAEYEYRNSKLKNDARYKKIWMGESLENKRIIVADEQGIGDVIQFLRFLKELKLRGAHVIFHCRKSLIKFTERIEWIDETVNLQEEYGNYDFAVSLLSLPYLLKINEENIPCDIPYIKYDEINKFEQFIKKYNGLKIGIAWKGNPEHKFDYKRSFRIQKFETIANIEGVIIFSLQLSLSEEEKWFLEQNNIIQLFEKDEAFENTISLIKVLDLIITVDTSIAHLAGAMGKKVWTLLPFAADWRWKFCVENSLWYPSMHLFRQKKPGSWDEVFKKISAELQKIIPQKRNYDEEYLVIKLKAFENHEAGNLDEAEKYYAALLRKNPCDPEILYWLAVLKNSQNKTDEAEKHLSLLINKNPSFSEESYIHLCSIFIRRKEEKNAEKYYLKGIALFPGSYKLLNDYGVFLAGIGKSDEAAGYFEQAIKINPLFTEAIFNAAAEAEKKCDYSKAEKYYLKVLEIISTDFNALTNLANLKLKTKKFMEAEEYYKKALSVKNDFNANNNLGFALQRQNKLDEAEHFFLRALEITPAYGVYYNLGNNFYLNGKFKEAQDYYLKSLEINADYREAKVALSFIQLSMKNFKEGWKNFKYSLFPNLLTEKAGIKKWEGEDLNGKTLLVYSEQGLGDNIHFARYIHYAKKAGAKIKFLCDKNLADLISNPEYAEFIHEIENPGEIDFCCSLLELPSFLFDLGVDDHSLVKYIKTDSGKSENNIINFPDEKIKIGFVWKGNPNHQFDAFRSAELENFLTLFELENACFYSLQITDEEEIKILSQKNSNVFTINFKGKNFTEFVSKLDLIITVDTMMAHFAGTLGKPVWILLAKVCDWRWGMEGSESYLYPSAKLFRQKELGNWEPIFKEIKENLLKLTNSSENLVRTEQEILAEAHKLIEQKEYAKAEALLKDAALHFPHSEEVYLLSGYFYQICENLHDALNSYLNIIKINPSNHIAYSNMGVVLKDLKRFDEAEKSLSIAIKINDSNAIAYNNMAIISHLKGDFEKSRGCLEKALALNPFYHEAYINLSNYYDTAGDMTKALESIEKAIEITPHSADAHFNKSVILLKEGYDLEGWKEYEWRKKKAEYQKRNFSIPELISTDVYGKTILVYDEQGYGDTIQFARYIEFLKQRGAKVILECHKSLVRLMKSCKGIAEVYSRGELKEKEFKFDNQTALLSLPLLLYREVSEIPANVPYLEANERPDLFWHENYSFKSAYKIGIFWRGKQPVTNLQRAANLKFFEHIAKMENVKIFSLQKEGITKEENEMMTEFGINDLSPQLGDFSDTASIIKALDLVITIDTSVAHLSGALGVKTWTILSKRADWRWYRKIDYSPWYPSMKLFRQENYNDWKTVFEKISKKLNTELLNHNKRS